MSLTNKINEVAAELRRYYIAGESAYVAYEINSKKSLLMVNPALKEVFYIDRHGRPLLPVEAEAIKAQLPEIKIVDISRLQSNSSLYNPSGFHANQPIYTDSNWLASAKEIIQTYNNKEKENVAERFQTAAAPQVGTFFTNKGKTPAPVGKDEKVLQENVTLKDTTNKLR